MARPLIAVTCSYLDSGDSPWAERHLVPACYLAALQGAGGTALLVPGLEDEDEVRRLLALTDGLLVTGGPDLDPRAYGQQPHAKFGAICPERDRLDRIALEYAFTNTGLPIMGICRGIQSINVVAGGTLIQDIPSQVTDALKHAQTTPGWYGTHDIAVASDSRLASILGGDSICVNTSHHQAVLDPAPGWEIVAHSEDGVVEAIERTDGAFGLGCQFHPELMVEREPRIAAIFAAFVDACQA